jgi:aldose 1-epimerase
MAPFANRIDGGVFTFADRVHVLPVNRPDENVAIHGLSRFEPFETLSQTDSTLVLLHRHRGDVFAYDLVQDVQIDPSGVAVRLTLVNRGRTMPFGIGLHPYFVRGEGARLQLSASARSVSDGRYLPIRFEAAGSGPEFVGGACLDGLEGYDAHYAGWQPRSAVLERPDAGIKVMITAAEAFSNVHVYIPPSGELICIEPVSHVPDIHNRTTLSEFGKLSVLEPHGVLRGSMVLSVSQR